MPGLNNKQHHILTFEDKLVKNMQIKINSINSWTLSGEKIYFIWSKKVLDGNTVKIVINNFEWLCNPNELKKQIVVLYGHWGKSGWTIPYSIKKNGVDLVHPTYKDKKY